MYRKLLFTIATIILFTSKVWCIEDTYVYLAAQKGVLDKSKNIFGKEQKDDYISSLETRNGIIRGNHKVNPTIFSFDFYKINGSFASGFGVELHNYKKIYSFKKNESTVSISAVGFLYGLNFYYRGDYWFPFIGFGTGNFSAKVKEELKNIDTSTNATVFGQVDKPFYYKFGARIPFNGLGLLITQQYTSAKMLVGTENKKLSLGGEGTFIGIFYIF